MAEYIERGALLDTLRRNLRATERGSVCYDCVMSAVEAVEAAPDADVAEMRHGHWYWDEDGMDWGLGAWKCSKCHSKPETWWEADNRINPYRCSGSHFCGNCGAAMDGEEAE